MAMSLSEMIQRCRANCQTAAEEARVAHDKGIVALDEHRTAEAEQYLKQATGFMKLYNLFESQKNALDRMQQGDPAMRTVDQHLQVLLSMFPSN